MTASYLRFMMARICLSLQCNSLFPHVMNMKNQALAFLPQAFIVFPQEVMRLELALAGRSFFFHYLSAPTEDCCFYEHLKIPLAAQQAAPKTAKKLLPKCKRLN